jgi:predicted negative regulator of RcsB-dependent stress response
VFGRKRNSRHNLPLLAVAALLVFAVTGNAQNTESGQLDASPTLFTIMAAIHAAGYNADLSSSMNSPLRDQVRAALAKQDIPSLAKIKAFYDRHRKQNDTDELAQYISFGLFVGPPPTFTFKTRDLDLPPDVRSMRELAPLLAVFYKEAHIDELWQQAQPEIDKYLERYHQGVSESVLQVNAYLRQQTSGVKRRRFQIYVELLAPPNQIQTRSYDYGYTIVITPSPEPRIFDVRHAYLHYLLDAMTTQYKDLVARKQPLMDHVQRAPALDPAVKDDILLLTTESLIKAVEARLDHKQAALRQGLILTPYFSEHLPLYEKQEQAMMFYFPEMVAAIDMQTEYQRLSQVQFDKEATVRMVHAAPVEAPPEPQLTGAAKTLDEAEKAYTARDLDKAKSLYLAVLQQTDDKPLHAAAYYGLARIAALSNDPETATKLFEKTLELNPEPQVKAWALVYLGRLTLASQEAARAGQYFRNALQVEGASPGALQAACGALEKAPPEQEGAAAQLPARCAEILKPR